MRIEDLELSVRAINVLLNAGYNDTDQLREHSLQDLLELPHMTRKCAKEILEVVHNTREPEKTDARRQTEALERIATALEALVKFTAPTISEDPPKITIGDPFGGRNGLGQD